MEQPEPISPMTVYSVTEVAQIVRADERTVRRAIREGDLRSFLPNGCKKGRRVLGSWIVQWLEERAAHA